jgi:protease I
MPKDLSNQTVAFLVANEGVEQVELTEPWKAVQEAGATPVLVAPESGEVQAFDHLDKADTFEVDRTVADVDVGEFDALVLPGGVANPDQLRQDEGAVAFVRDFMASGKPVAAICHAPWTLVEADVVRGRTITSWPSLQTDIRNAGATWVDEEVHVDAGLVTSRKPDDIPAFCSKLLEEMQEGRHERREAPSAAEEQGIVDQQDAALHSMQG